MNKTLTINEHAHGDDSRHHPGMGAIVEAALLRAYTVTVPISKYETAVNALKKIAAWKTDGYEVAVAREALSALEAHKT